MVLVLAAASALWGPQCPPARGALASADASLDRLAQGVRRGGCAEAIAGLGSMATGADLESLRAAYLLGWCLGVLGRHDAAAAAFRAASAHPALRLYAQLGEATALTRSGRAAEATEALSALAAATSGRLRGRVWLALGEAELARDRPAAAAAALWAAAALRPDDPRTWWLLGTAAGAAGRRDLARTALGRVAWGFPGNPQEVEAREALSQLLGRPFSPTAADPEARLARGRRLLQQGAWDQALAEFRAAMAATSRALAGEAAYRAGELLLRTDPEGAYGAFRLAAASGWNTAGAWFWAASAARRAGMVAQAREAAQALMRTAPTGLWAGRFWLAAGLRAESAGRAADAAAAYRRVVEVAADSGDAVEARWRLGWLALRGGRHADAHARFRTAAETAPWRGAAARAWYWAAKALEATGSSRDADAAARLVRMVADRYPLTFYGQRARARLGLGPPELPPSLPHAFPRGAAAPVHEELARLGLDGDAADAAEDALALRPEPRLLRFLADVYARLGDIPRSVACAEEALGGGVRDDGTWRLAYPRAFWPEVTDAARAAGIDPLLLLALVREESRYDPAVISPAGAVGLAQLLPQTAQALSGELGRTRERLKEPATNLTLGARYLRLQLDRFDGDLRLALAAYNAGPGAARRWVGLDPDPDHFVERIPFAETRAYVQRVLGAYGIYRLLW
ncbi:MAG: lytic transglycosylase domain-containing protein [Armatimonadota bacterium]|nr:lytic transglycosylase domain-containing protein [Armatimonadota bacterium]